MISGVPELKWCCMMVPLQLKLTIMWGHIFRVTRGLDRVIIFHLCCSILLLIA
jgi:hypothetical protein